MADVGLTYKLLKTTTVSFNASNSIIPTLGGALQQSNSFGMALNHQINQLSNVGVYKSVFYNQWFISGSPICISNGRLVGVFFSVSQL